MSATRKVHRVAAFWQAAHSVALLALAGLACSVLEPSALPTDEPTQSNMVQTYAPIVTATRSVEQATLPAATSCAFAANGSSQRYALDATVDFAHHTASADLRATYNNKTGHSLPKLVMNVEPNRKPGVFQLASLTGASGTEVDSYALTGPRLEVTLKVPLPPDCQATLLLAFTVKPGIIVQTYVNNIGYFGYSEHQLNLGEWLPKFAPIIGGDFYTPRAWPLGQYIVSDLGDYDVTVRLAGKDSAQLQVAGPGQVSRQDIAWQFKSQAARNFTLSIGPMQKLTTVSDDGVQVDLYYFGGEQQPIRTQASEVSVSPPSTITPTPTGTQASVPVPAAALAALETARLALNRYTTLFGSLPGHRIVVVEGAFPDGMEFSGLVFVGQQWFTQYTGLPDTWLTIITAHELAHQWWYSLVGDDGGNAPFMKEGLAVYSEALFMESEHPTLLPWWWSFRVNAYDPQGYVDSSIYDFQNLRLYINAVYLRGALMLQEVRKTIGDAAFFKWLRDFRDARAGKLAGPADLWAAMSPEDYLRTAPIRFKYLHNPDPLHRPPTPIPTIGPGTPAP